MPDTSVTETFVKHTPGPWKVVHKRVIERPIRISEHFAVAPAAGPTLAFLPEGRADLQEANANLVAAAPELLKACALFTSAAHEARDLLNSKGFACPASIALAAELARNAIVKAEGGAR